MDGLKLSITRGHCKVIAENPDDRFKDFWRRQMMDAIQQEILEFLQEVQVAMRNIEPGQTVTLVSKPMEVTIERPQLAEAVTPS